LILSIWEKNGGVPLTERGEELPPHQVVDTLKFVVTPDYKNHDFLRQKYVEERLSIKQISRLTASSKDSVRKGLQAAGISLRPHGHHHGHPSQPRFGKRICKGREVQHKAEQKVVTVVQNLRNQQMTYRQIAQTLSQLGIPTKCRGRGWHPEMVRRVLVGGGATVATAASLFCKSTNVRKKSLRGGGQSKFHVTQARPKPAVLPKT
jgi:hypothetical protein